MCRGWCLRCNSIRIQNSLNLGDYKPRSYGAKDRHQKRENRNYYTYFMPSVGCHGVASSM
jgi:hypothetical protein